MFSKVLVANRGEIAVRVMRACEELGVRTVAVYSDADIDAGHVRYADEAYNIGPASASESYLDGDAVLTAARKAGVDAIHPGYGFLAENAAFARQVEESQFVWIGPSAHAMEQLGEKTGARRLMDRAGVPIVPGTTDSVDSPEAVREFADDHGYPIAIKAEGGGGGRGLKVATDSSEVDEQFEAATREGEAYFDNDSVYVEKYLSAPRHIEVQILADEHGTVRHLGERDCSLQRRHQKVIEEAPSPALDDDLREEIGEAARRGVREAGYTNAGTVEFLLEDEAFYFMEVNTRIQVEHTVTEAITGIDIVKWQIRIAAGEPIDFDQDAVEFDGHAIEYRLNAENPAAEFAPATGTLERYHPAGGIGVRIDDAVHEGDEIGGEYDSMIAKLIVEGSDRREALARSERALAEYEIDGLHTTIPFHRLMLTDKAFRAATHTTDYLDTELSTDRIDQAVEKWGPDESTSSGGRVREVDREFTVEVDGKRFDVALAERGAHSDSQPTNRPAAPAPQKSTAGSSGLAAGEEITAEMQGTILSVAVSEGDTVEPDDVVCVLEAMKMENDVIAERGGTVVSVPIREGDSVDMGDTLIVLE